MDAKSLIDQGNELIKQGRHVLAQEISTNVAGFFADVDPIITAISHTQYTPYFNDGDECRFEVNCDMDYALALVIDGTERQSEELFDGEYDRDTRTMTHTFARTDYGGEPVNEDISVEVGNDTLRLATMYSQYINGLDQDSLRFIFGEGRVTFNRDGTYKVDTDYEHE